MFRTRRLREEIEHLRAERDSAVKRAKHAEKALETERCALGVAARQFTDADTEVQHLRNELQRARAERDHHRSQAAAQARLAKAQQAQLDELLGLNDPAVQTGARWQEAAPTSPQKGHTRDR